eukprot:scaffold77257_cov65-Phaeocystis_antarctica.AAC.1
MTEYNPAPSPSGHPLLSGPPTLTDIHQIFTGNRESGSSGWAPRSRRPAFGSPESSHPVPPNFSESPAVGVRCHLTEVILA